MLFRRWYRLRRRVRRNGPRIHRRRYCELHGARVWWTTRATRSKRGAVFCSRECKAERAQPTREQALARAARLAPKCPRPDKRAFSSEDECLASFQNLLLYDADLHPYLCRCGDWHAGHARLGVAIVERVPSETAAALSALVERIHS